jgi:DNA-binding NarL/FixJ family response regulator
MIFPERSRPNEKPPEAMRDAAHKDTSPHPHPQAAQDLDCWLLTAFGQSAADVASHIYISESRGRFHWHNAARKLAVRGRWEATYRAAKLGLI